MAPDDRIRDLFLRHQLRLDGAAATTAAQISEVVRLALKDVESLIRAQPGESFSRTRLLALRGQLALLRENLEFRIAAHTRSLAEGVVGTAPAVVEEAARVLSDSVLSVSLVRPSEAVLTEVFSRPFDGRSWSSWGRKLGRDVTGRVQQELARAEALGEGIPAISRRLRAVTGLARSRADALARTMVSDVGNRARVALAEQVFGDVVRGWRYTATLDGRTSLVCAGLDGRTWREGDEAIQRPPLHPNCRSVLVPTTDPDRPPEGERPEVVDTRTPRERERDFRRGAKDRVGLGRWNRMAEPRRRELISVERSRWRRSRVGQVSAGTSFEEWFSAQPIAFQRDFLGVARFNAFRRGLPIEAMATTSRPLTIAELSRRYPSELAS